MTLLDGKALSAKIKQELKEKQNVKRKWSRNLPCGNFSR